MQDESTKPSYPTCAPMRAPTPPSFRIDVIRIPLVRPEDAAVVSRPKCSAIPRRGRPGPVADRGPGAQRTAESSRRQDVTAFPEIGLATGACSGNGILLDISDPVNPGPDRRRGRPAFALLDRVGGAGDSPQTAGRTGRRPRALTENPGASGGSVAQRMPVQES